MCGNDSDNPPRNQLEMGGVYRGELYRSGMVGSVCGVPSGQFAFPLIAMVQAPLKG